MTVSASVRSRHAATMPRSSRLFAAVLCCGLRILFPPWAALAAEETTGLFAEDRVPQLRLSLDEDAEQLLRDDPRRYVAATLVEDDEHRVGRIGVKLKGAAGSYRDYDDRPGLTLRADKYRAGRTFHGMTKFHLNNAVQDDTFLNEWLGWQLFRDAGYPAPRVAHVRLWINDRDMGLYVLREGFDEPFLRREFGDGDGTLYDGGFLQDIDEPLEVDLGAEADDRAALRRLAVACTQPSPAERFRLLEEQLDVARFLQFMALERLAGHWDGYTLNTNNYRLYVPAGGRGVFLPHGMDQILGDPGAGLYDQSAALVARCIFEHPEWPTAYRDELRRLAPLLADVDRWIDRVASVRDRLEPVLREADPETAADYGRRIEQLQARLRERAERLEDLVEQGPPVAVDVPPGRVVLLAGWHPVAEAEGVELEEVEVDERPALAIRGGPGAIIGGWRCSVVLGRGRYRMEASVKTDDVVPIRGDVLRGASLHRQDEPAGRRLVGSHEWSLCADEFDVPEDQRQIVFIVELRARHGAAWIDRHSLLLRRLE